MKSWVCFVTNNYSEARVSNKIKWEWIYHIERDKFSMEWTFTLDWNIKEFVWVISFTINDIVYGNDSDILLFSYLFWYKPIWENKLLLPNVIRDIWYLKLQTWLNKEEEKFLRYYNKMSTSEKNKVEPRYIEIHQKIKHHMIEEKERLMHILNDEKWHGGDLDFF